MKKFSHFIVLSVIGLIVFQFASCKDDDVTPSAPQIKDLSIAQLHDAIEGVYVDTIDMSRYFVFTSLKLEKERAVTTLHSSYYESYGYDSLQLIGTWRILDLCDIITDDNNRIVPIELAGNMTSMFPNVNFEEHGYDTEQFNICDTMLAVISNIGNVYFISSSQMGELSELSGATTIGQLLNDMNNEGQTRGWWDSIKNGCKLICDGIVKTAENVVDAAHTVKNAGASFVKSTAEGVVAYGKWIQEVFASSTIYTSPDYDEWMSHIKGNVPVRFVSIPGSHDSFTASIPHGDYRYPFGITQHFGPYDLWARGCRQFDIRLSYHWNRTGDDKFEIIHEREDLLCDWTAKKAFDAITDLLSKHKEETAVVVVKFDFIQDERKLEADTCLHNFLKNKYDSYIAKFYPGITMKEARGKMIIIDRTGKLEKDSVQQIPGKDDKIASLSGAWGNNKYSSFYYDYDKHDGKLIVQDEYGMDPEQTLESWIDLKLQHIDTCFDMSSKDNDAWIFNHTSGYTKGAISNVTSLMINSAYSAIMSYSQNAFYTNDHANIYLQENLGKHIGIIVMDFLGSESIWFGHSPYGKVLPVTIINYNKTLKYNGELIWKDK